MGSNPPSAMCQQGHPDPAVSPSATPVGAPVLGEGAGAPTNPHLEALHTLVGRMRAAIEDHANERAFRFLNDLDRELTVLETALLQEPDRG